MKYLFFDTKTANNTTTTVTNRVKILKEKFSQSLGLPFGNMLPESVIEQALCELKIKYRRRLFDPFVTLWAFLSQEVDADKSCHHAVSRVSAWLTAENAPPTSCDTSAYCQARKRLPERLLQQLFGTVAHNLEQKVTSQHLWCGRHVKVIDGTTVSMPDTSCNQLAFPQSTNQSPGCGFPIAKIGAIFSIATGAAVASRY